jgi:hypothetical protein
MKIMTDVAETSDYGQIGSEHYMNLRDTSLGERVAELMRETEEALLYGDVTQAGVTGDAFDAEAFNGIAKTCSLAGTSVNKAAEGEFLADLKATIASMLDSGYNILRSDLEIWVSNTMHNALEEDMGTKTIIQAGTDTARYGYPKIVIDGVPVIAGDNIKQHTFTALGGATTVGSAGDVFIVNKRAIRMYSLAPLSIIPLARIGLADRTGLFQFLTYADRSAGLFCRYL